MAEKMGSGESAKNSRLIRPRLALLLICGACLMLVVFFAWQNAQQTIPDGRMNSPVYSKHPAMLSTWPEYRFAVHPLHNPQRLFDNFQPMIDILNEQAARKAIDASHAKGTEEKDFSVRLIAARDYASFEKRIAAREFDFALTNPLQALLALKHGYKIVGKMGDDDNFRGLIIGRRDSGIKKVQDLNGREMIFPAPTALAATMMPRYYLHEHGADMSKVASSYSGSQESAIMNVYLGKVDAAGTWPMPWELFLKERPELARELKVLWRTEPLINNAIVVRNDLPPEHVRRVMQAMTSLQDTAKGRNALKRLSLSHFEAIDDVAYVPPVQSFLKAYHEAFPNESKPQQEDDGKKAARANTP